MKSEPIGFVRQSEADPRIVEGIAVPYGRISRPTEMLRGSGEIIRETWAPGAFAQNIAEWNAHPDGRKMAFRPSHGERSIGSVFELRDTPDGPYFRAKIRTGPRGDAYLEEVSDGLNGVSIEGMWNEPPKRTKDGVVVHRSGQLQGIAGSDAPAYDGASVARRDMEAVMAENETPAPPDPEPIPEPEPAPEPPAAARLKAERDAVSQFVSSISITRPELVYSRDSQFNYMHDQWAISGKSLLQNKAEAGERVAKHTKFLEEIAVKMERDAYSRAFDPGMAQRAGDVLSTEIPGAYPNDYLPGLLTPRIFKRRPMGDFFNRIPISDARPRIFPKVTTSGTVATFAEGVAPTATDIATTAVTVTPSAYGTYTDVSRQALDGGDPNVLSIIFQDLVEAYSQASETAIKVAVEAGASASGTAITAATPWAGELGNVVKYYATRFRPCEAAFVPSALYSVLLAQGDTTGRPFMPQLGPVNSDGTVNSGGVNGNILGAQAFLSWASTVNVNVFAVSNDYVIYESSIVQFTYDQVVGPQSVRVGLWAYLGIGTRLGGLSVTAA